MGKPCAGSPWYLGTKGAPLSLPRGPPLWGRLCWVPGCAWIWRPWRAPPTGSLQWCGHLCLSWRGGHSIGWTLCLPASHLPLPSLLSVPARPGLVGEFGAFLGSQLSPGLPTAVLGHVAPGPGLPPRASQRGEHSPPRAHTGVGLGACSAFAGGAVTKVRAGEGRQGRGAGGRGVPNPGYFWVLILGTSSTFCWVLCQRLPLPPCDHL